MCVTSGLSRHLLEHLAGQMGKGAGTGGAIGGLTGICLDVCNQLLQVFRRNRRMDADRNGGVRDNTDGDEVLGRIVGRLRHDGRIEYLCAGIAEQQGVAVRRRASDLAGADRTAGAALVLDDHRAEQRLHLVGPQPADHVHHAAGCKRNDQLDGAIGIV